MRLRARFVHAVAEVEADRSEPVTPSQLCTIAARLLGATSAGLVMSCQLIRLPVGASDDDARTAEEIQAGLGVGPCLTAEATRSVLAAEAPELARRWPAYHEELTRRTPFRATLSFPLFHARAGFAALNLYYCDTTAALTEELDIAQDEVADQVAIRLVRHQLRRHDDEDAGPVSDGQHRRRQVWIAVGILQQASGATGTDALALLRGHVFRTERLIGDVADDLVRRRLPVSAVLGPLT